VAFHFGLVPNPGVRIKKTIIYGKSFRLVCSLGSEAPYVVGIGSFSTIYLCS